MLNLLSNSELTKKLSELTKREQELTAEIVELLKEFDQRKLYLELGYPSLFQYATDCLGYSANSAYLRINAARVVNKVPEILPLLKTGEINLTTVKIISPVLTKENREEVLNKVIKKSTREVEVIVTEMDTRAVKKDTVEIKFEITREQYDKLQESKVKLSTKYPGGISNEEVLDELLDYYLKPKNVTNKEVKTTSWNRYIPSQIVSRVWERDRGVCQFVSSTGKQCNSRWNLQIDHIRPFAKGGTNEAGNLRLLCAGHNRLLATQEYGSKLMSKYCNSSRNELLKSQQNATSDFNPSN